LGFSRRGQALFVGTFGGHLLHVNPTTAQTRGYVGVEPGRPAGDPTHASAVTAVLTPPDGKSLCTVSQDGAVLAWPTAGPPQAPRLTFHNGRPVTAVALAPDGRTLATGGQDGLIRLWEVPSARPEGGATTARELMTLPGHPGGVSALVFGTGGHLVSAGLDERVRVWDITSGRATYTVIQPTADLCVALSADGKTLAIGGRKLSGVRLVNLAHPGKPRLLSESGGEVTAIAFTPSGDRIFTGSAGGVVRVWNATTGEEMTRCTVGVGAVNGISFTPSGALAAVVLNTTPRTEGETEHGPAYQVVFLDARDGSVLDDPAPLSHAGPVTAAAVLTDGEALTAAHDGNLYLWELRTGRAVRTIRGHVDAVRGFALAADGTAVVSAGDRAAKWWPLKVQK
jgi:WD40 repeat protein